MEVRAKKALGQHFLVDQGAAQRIVAALEPIETIRDVLEIGPGMGVLTQYLLKREDIDLKMVELDEESVNYLLTHFNGMQGRLFLADYLKLNVDHLFKGPYRVIGNFPYNISSQIFFKILESRDRIPEVVCMIQKEVAERIAEGPGSKTYGILSVLLRRGTISSICLQWSRGRLRRRRKCGRPLLGCGGILALRFLPTHAVYQAVT